MKRKLKNLFKLTCCLLPFASFAQKVDLDRYNIHCDFKDLPAKPLGEAYSTFAVEVGVPGNVLNSISRESIENGISIRGLKRVATSPSFIVYFNSEDLVITDVGVKEYVDIQKDSKGNETGRKTSYYVSASYSLKCEGKCYTAQKQLVYSATFGTSQSKYNSDYMATHKEATEYWNNNKESLKSSFIAGIINPSITAMGNKLSADYGYVTHSGYDVLWILNSKKHPEHEAQQTVIAKIKDEFGRMKADSSIEWLARDMEPVIQYFNEVEAKYNKDEKGDKKMRYAAYYNKAIIYTYLDQPDKAVAEADKLVANGYDPKDGERLKKHAEELRSMLDSNKKTTTHFVL
jgi:hypothetical protein